MSIWLIFWIAFAAFSFVSHLVITLLVLLHGWKELRELLRIE